MAVLLPPVPRIVFPPAPAPHPPPPPPWRPPDSPTNTNDSSSKSPGGIIAGVCIGAGILLFLLSCICSLARDHRRRRGNAEAHAAAIAARPSSAPADPWWGDDDQQLRRSAHDGDRDGRQRRAMPTADLPSFTYNVSVAHNVTTGGGDDTAAATCSVCLGAFQVGEKVRLLPVCLHLYHVECIDPWLDAHSTCPICRSGTDSTMDGSLLPPV